MALFCKIRSDKWSKGDIFGTSLYCSSNDFFPDLTILSQKNCPFIFQKFEAGLLNQGSENAQGVYWVGPEIYLGYTVIQFQL